MRQDLPDLSFGRFPRSDLKTDGGRARAAALWLQGYGQVAIGQHFGWMKNPAVWVSLEIGTFVERYGQSCGLLQTGEKRKPFVSEALERYCAARMSPDQVSGDRPDAG